MKGRNALHGVLLAAYLILWLGGVFSYAVSGAVRPGTGWAAPLFLLVAGLIVMVSARAHEWPLLLAALVLGLASEIIGVRYGWPFGAYRYTEVLGPRLLSVPVVIGCAWVVLAAYVRQMALRVGVGRAAGIGIAAAWMTAIDFVIDPLAANGLGYWRWEEAGIYYGIPATNFAGWYLVSVLIFATDRVLGSEWKRNRWAEWIGLSILLFFTLIAVASKLTLAAAIGAGLLSCQAALIGFKIKSPAL